MAKYTLYTGLSLIILGLYGYFSYNTITVLIPAFIGLVISFLGILSFNENRKKLVIHITAVVVIVGLSASAKSLPSIPGLIDCFNTPGLEIINCSKFQRPLAELFKSIMSLILIPYLLVSISFFVKARLSK
tara:strand:- start:192 stop:584 length:393 start_codon:yes stop_codon:yes gene_type:complete